MQLLQHMKIVMRCYNTLYYGTLLRKLRRATQLIIDVMHHLEAIFVDKANSFVDREDLNWVI